MNLVKFVQWCGVRRSVRRSWSEHRAPCSTRRWSLRRSTWRRSKCSFSTKLTSWSEFKGHQDQSIRIQRWVEDFVYQNIANISIGVLSFLFRGLRSGLSDAALLCDVRGGGHALRDGSRQELSADPTQARRGESGQHQAVLHRVPESRRKVSSALQHLRSDFDRAVNDILPGIHKTFRCLKCSTFCVFVRVHCRRAVRPHGWLRRCPAMVTPSPCSTESWMCSSVPPSSSDTERAKKRCSSRPMLPQEVRSYSLNQKQLQNTNELLLFNYEYFLLRNRRGAGHCGR